MVLNITNKDKPTKSSITTLMDHSSYYKKIELLKQLLLKEDQHDLKTLALRLNVSIRTTYRMIQDLKEIGFIGNYDRKKKIYMVIWNDSKIT